MGVEVDGFEMVQGPVETVTVGETKENGKLDQAPRSHGAIKFGSHGDEPVKEEENVVSQESHFPKDAADEWPTQKVHSFYIPRFRSYDDPKIKLKIDQAAVENEKRTQARFKITEQLKAKRADRQELITQIKALNSDNRQIRTIVDEKLKEITPLHQALGKLRNANSANRGVCSSEEELNSVIHSLQYRIQHESIPLSEEKQILRDIKQLESTRPHVVANDALKAKIQDSMVHKEALQDQVKVIGGDLDGVRKEQQVVRAKIKQIDDVVKAIDKDIATLQDELAAVTEKRDKARDSIQQFRKQRDDGNSHFYQSRSVLNKAKDLAAKKDVQALEEFINSEVENFMSLWNSTGSFRDDYEKRILSSLDARQLSRDGRMRNPGEKPLVVVEQPAAPAESEVKALPKRAKEEPKPAQVVDSSEPATKTQKEVKSKSKSSKLDGDEEDAVVGSEKLLVEAPIPPKKEKEIDVVALKETKRQEEIAKAKQAMERKKKLAEKAAAKAAIRAQKEAEKKIKEREKKLKKKSGGAFAADGEEAAEAESEAVEAAENESEGAEAPPAPAAALAKVSHREMASVRPRGRARGGTDTIPKAILKRKKTTNYWVWALPAAAVLVAVFVGLGYRYIL